ncbi:MAG: DEAD/DEAH box helicase [Candidatus Absconditabacterales bacterium]|nr:DEAD/DEAH box helicase [Candidatus Absconditabacterales bacterium]
MTTPQITFADLGLAPHLLDALNKKGYKHPTPIQELVIPILIAGNQDCIGQAQTGTGKTAAFSLPILHKITPGTKKIQALILAPTRELAVQVAEEIKSFASSSLRVLPVYGGTPIGPQVRSLKAGVDIVVGTPGRVLDHLGKGVLRLDDIQFLVLDEADEMLAMGFIDDMREVMRHANPSAQKLFFSATMPREILSLAKEFMPNYQLLKVEKQQLTTGQVKQRIIPCRESDKIAVLTRVIDAHPEFYGIVFCETKRDCDDLLNALMHQGYDVEAIHGDVAQAQREKTLARFKSRTITILLATDVAARGIDVNDLTHVINYTLPRDTDSYVHRIGRTGRAGKEGNAISLVTPADRRRLDIIRRTTKADIVTMPLPSATQIVAGKITHLTDAISKYTHDSIPQHVVDAYTSIVTSIGDEALIAKALLTIYAGQFVDPKQYKDIEMPRTEGLRDDRYGSDGGCGFERRDRRGRDDYPSFTNGGNDVRLFVGLGRQDGYNGIPEIISYFQNETKIPGNRMKNVRLFDTHTFVSLSANDAFTFMEHFNMGVQGRKLVQYAIDNPGSDRGLKEKKYGSDRSGRGSFGPNDGGNRRGGYDRGHKKDNDIYHRSGRRHA